MEPEAEEVTEEAPANASVFVGGGRLPESSGLEDYIEKLKALPEYEDLGQLFKTCQPLQLTEEDTEYKITVIKHIFEGHTVFQFNCTNTIKEQVLEDVCIAMDLAEAVSSKLEHHTQI